MPNITYVLADGTRRCVIVPAGRTLMEGSTRNNLPGIVAECGGGCSCGTCHVYLTENSGPSFEEMSDEERELLELTDGYVNSQSRLSCQLVLTEEHEGLIVTIPPTND